MNGCILIVALLGAAPDSDTRLAPPPAPRLDGGWKLLVGELDGVPLAGQILAGCTVAIRDQRALIEYRHGDIIEAGQLDFTLDRDHVRVAGHGLSGRWRLEQGLLHIWLQDPSSRAHFVLYRTGN